MTSIVINVKHGGFGLSNKAITRYTELKGAVDEYTVERDDPILVQVIEELGKAADGEFAKLKIVEIPDNVEWQIDEYDGVEWIAEKHRVWR